MLGIEMRHLVKQDLHLLGGKQAREEEIAVAVELFDLLLCELHRVSSVSPVSSCVPCRRPLPGHGQGFERTEGNTGLSPVLPSVRSNPCPWPGRGRRQGTHEDTGDTEETRCNSHKSRSNNSTATAISSSRACLPPRRCKSCLTRCRISMPSIGRRTCVRRAVMPCAPTSPHTCIASRSPS